MGYSTTFEGELKFKSELTASQLAKLNVYLGADRRDIGYPDESVYEDGKYGNYWYHIDLELVEDFSGIRWNEAEKTYGLVDIVNWLTDKMKEVCDSFELTGEIVAQGEDHDDRWKLVMRDGKAVRVGYPRIGDRVKCPCCGEQFTLED